MADVTRQVIIEFSTDTSQLAPTIDQLEQIGTIEKGAAAAFKQTNAEAAKQAKVLQDIAKSEAAINTNAQPLKKSLADITGLVKQMGPTFQKEFQKGVAQGLKEAGVSAEEFEQALNGVDSKSKSLKAQLREMTAELAKMKVAGQDNTKEYQTLAREAGELKDAIGDAAQEVANFGNDTRNIDGIIGVVQGAAGAFAAVQGAAALFGDESEELQKTLLKVNAAMAILQGLQQVQVALQKESAASMFLNTVATKAQTVAQVAYNVVVGTSTGLLKALRIALAATGLGAIVLVVVSLVNAWRNWNDEIKANNALIDQQKKSQEELLKTLQNQAEIRQAMAGDETQRLERQSVALIREQKALLDRNKQILENLKLEGISNDRRNELIKEQIAGVERLKDIQHEQALNQIALDKSIADAKADALKKQQAADEDAAKKAEEARLKALQDVIYRIQQELVFVREGSRQQLELRKMLLQAEANLEIQQAKDDAEKIKLIRLQLIKDTYDAEIEFIRRTGQGVLTERAKIEQLRLNQTREIDKELEKSIDESAKRMNEKRAADRQKEIDDYKKGLDEKRAAEMAFYQNSIEIGQNAIAVLAGFFNAQNEAENQRISDARQNIEDLKAAGAITEKEAQNRLKRLEAEEKRARQQQAQREKQIATFNALLAIPQAFLRGLTTGGPVLAGIYAAIAAVQAALVAARPVPKFGTGKKGSYEGFAEVGEIGAELVEQGGRMWVADKSQITYLGKKDKVYNPSETALILGRNKMSTERPQLTVKEKQFQIDYARLGKEVGKNIPQQGWNFDDSGFSSYVRKQNQNIIDLNKRRSF